MTAAVLSPCIGVCELDAQGFCTGCHRSADEIAAWLTLRAHERQWLMDVILPAREAQRG